jgi:hypothetical protein
VQNLGSQYGILHYGAGQYHRLLWQDWFDGVYQSSYVIFTKCVDPDISAYELGMNAGTAKDKPNITVSDMTVIGCTLSLITNQSAVVDASTKKLLSVDPAAIKMESEWLPWNPLAAKFDPQIDGVSSAEGYVPSWANFSLQYQVGKHVYSNARWITAQSRPLLRCMPAA